MQETKLSIVIVANSINLITSSSKGDLQHLVYLCDFLKRSASAIGFYEVRECCGNIKKGGVMSSGDSSALVGVEVPCLSCIQGEIGTLKDSICFARRAIDSYAIVEGGSQRARLYILRPVQITRPSRLRHQRVRSWCIVSGYNSEYTSNHSH